MVMDLRPTADAANPRNRLPRSIAWAMLLWATASAPGRGVAGGAEHIDSASREQVRSQLVSAELHYPRIPRAYWRDRIQKANGMGCNAVSTYVFWNLHEPRPGEFRFEGEADVAAFVRTAGEEGMKVILRSGPCVCGEWDLGGLPAWLLADPHMHLRSNYGPYLQATERYFQRLGRELAELQATRGGPITLIQVENEYSNYEGNPSHLERLRDQLRAAGFDVPLFTTTWPSAEHVRLGSIPGCLNAVALARNAASVFAEYGKVNPSGPYFCSEFWVGWFDQWGGSHRRSYAADLAQELEWMLSRGISVNFYMFQGGTTPGFYNGANGVGPGQYYPTTTSYDYDAILDEAGRPTDKFNALREVIRRHLPTGTTLPEPPVSPPTIEIARFELNESAAIADILGPAVERLLPVNMEALGQSYGYILYRTKVKGPVQGLLTVGGLHDYAVVLVNGHRIGAMDRRHPHSQQLELRLPAGEVTLELLVENSGRINFGQAMNGERKGILGEVALAGTPLTGWQHFTLPMEDLNRLRFSRRTVASPVFRRGVFRVERPGDTFLDLRGWGKGQVWLNGRNLGRHWCIGPQQTMYCPGVWLKRGANELVVLEIEERGHRSVAGLKDPVYGGETDPLAPAGRVNAGARLRLHEKDLRYQGSFPDTGEAQTIRFPAVEARFICLQALSAHAGHPHAAVAELDVLGAEGRVLPRDRWEVRYVDSEELKEENGSAENAFDGKAETYWHSAWSGVTPRFPHLLVIDLGEVVPIEGVRYLPRQEDKPGRIKDFKFYARKERFVGLIQP